MQRLPPEWTYKLYTMPQYYTFRINCLRSLPAWACAHTDRVAPGAPTRDQAPVRSWARARARHGAPRLAIALLRHGQRPAAPARHTHTHTHIHTHTHTHTRTHTHTHTHTHATGWLRRRRSGQRGMLCVCMCVSVCVCKHMHIPIRRQRAQTQEALFEKTLM